VAAAAEKLSLMKQPIGTYAGVSTVASAFVNKELFVGISFLYSAKLIFSNSL
jgi:hypothetical protein